MYFPSQKLIILEVPKCGSRTLVYSGKKQFGENHFAGHLSIKNILYRIDKENKGRRLNWEVEEVIRVVREPLDRFVSAINYSFSKKAENLDNSIEMMLSGKPKALTSTQTIWADTQEIPVKTWPIHRMRDVLKYIGYEDGMKWENKSDPVYTADDVRNHDRYPEILDKYAPDFDLWNQYK